jgi:hypothetical protein
MINYDADVGSRTDNHYVNSLYGRAEALTEHAHSSGKVYPTLDDGVTITGAAEAWTLGNFTEIVPANTITSALDIHYINFEDVSANDVYEIVLYAGALASEVEIGRIRTYKTPASFAPPSPFQCVIQPANTRISAKLASKSGGSDTATISIQYHTY